MAKLNYAQNSNELEQKALRNKKLKELGLSSPEQGKVVSPTYTGVLPNPTNNPVIPNRAATQPILIGDKTNYQFKTGAEMQGYQPTTQPILIGDKTNYQFKTGAEMQGYQPTTIGGTSMYKGVSKEGNTSYVDKAFVDQLNAGNTSAGVSRPLPILDLPLSRATQQPAALPATAAQSFLPNPIRSIVDNTQARDAIAKAISTFGRNMSVGENRANAKEAGKLLDKLLGYQSLDQRGNESAQAQAQSQNQFEANLQQRGMDRQQAAQTNQGNQDLNTRRLALDESRLALASQPKPVAPPQPQLIKTGTSENGDNSYRIYDPQTQQFSTVNKTTEVLNEEAFASQKQQIMATILDPTEQAQALAELEALRARSKRAKK